MRKSIFVVLKLLVTSPVLIIPAGRLVAWSLGTYVDAVYLVYS